MSFVNTKVEADIFGVVVWQREGGAFLPQALPD